MGAADLVLAYVNGCSTGVRNSNIFEVECKPAPSICTGNLVRNTRQDDLSSQKDNCVAQHEICGQFL